jgi:hypothetical protein
MTTLERCVCALNHKQPDRTPIWEALEHKYAYDYLAPDEKDWQIQASIACRELGIDMTYGAMYPPESGGATAGDGQVIAGDTYWATEPRWRTVNDLEEQSKAPADVAGGQAYFLEVCRQQVELFAPHTVWVSQDLGFEFIPSYDEETLIVFQEAWNTNRDALRRFWDLSVSYAVGRAEIYAKRRIGPCVQMCVDLACKHGLLIHPDIIRGEFFPRIKLIMQPLHDAGIKCILHSDGDITSILDDIVEAGIDGIDPVEPCGNMDIGRIKEQYGDKLVLVGNVDNDVLARGTKDEVAAAVRHCIKSASRCGGHFIQCGAGQIRPGVPLENLIAYCETVRETGTMLGD